MTRYETRKLIEEVCPERSHKISSEQWRFYYGDWKPPTTEIKWTIFIGTGANGEAATTYTGPTLADATAAFLAGERPADQAAQEAELAITDKEIA